MSTYLRPGPVDVSSGTTETAVIVGDAPQWADGSDATYSQTITGAFGGAGQVMADLDPYGGPATVSEIGWYLRADMTGDSTFAKVELWGLVPSSHFLLIIGGSSTGIPIPAGAGPADYRGVIDQATLDHYGETLESIAAEARTGLRVIASASNGDTLRIYEFALIFPSTSHAPPLRQYPRSDGLGTSSARRMWPPSRSYQRSNRRAGGYL